MSQPEHISASQEMVAILAPFIGGIVGACITGLYSLATKQRDYENDYYKTVVAKRIAAYEQLESLILELKTSVLDEDKRPYHWIFRKEDDFLTAHAAVTQVMQHALWLSNACYKKVQELNRLLFRLSASGNAIEFGKVHYVAMAQLRAELEDILAGDMTTLHQARQFLRTKTKNADSGFEPLRL